MKMIVESTSSDFMLILNPPGELIDSHRPTVVTKDEYLQKQIDAGKVHIIVPEVPDEALDADLKRIFDEEGRDKDKALSKFRQFVGDKMAATDKARTALEKQETKDAKQQERDAAAEQERLNAEAAEAVKLKEADAAAASAEAEKRAKAEAESANSSMTSAKLTKK